MSSIPPVSSYVGEDGFWEITIHQRMACILAELPAIGKDAFNQQQNFHFRSHDSVLNALNPLLAKWGVFVVPDVLERITSERKTSKGSTMYEVNLLVRYTFFGLTGDFVVASAWGEGTDMGDKATNKAMTMAFKNVLAQAFAVSTADTVDTDSTTPEETEGRRAPAQLRELERLIEAVKKADQDPAHGGGYWYQVAVNAAVKYHEKKLDDLSPGEISDLETRFRAHLKELTVGEERAEEKPEELPVDETIVRTGPSISYPASWAELEASIRTYGDQSWADFYEFLDQAKDHLWPDGKRMSAQRKQQLFQKASTVTLALLERHDPSEFPPPARLEYQALWSMVLDGHVLEGPAWAMSPDEAAAGRPLREQKPAGEEPKPEAGEAPGVPPAGAPSEGERDPQTAEAATATSPGTAPPAPSEQTFTDGPLTDDEQAVVDALREEFPGAVEVPSKPE